MDVTHPPSTKNFDKVKYCYPNSKKQTPLRDYNNNTPIDGNFIDGIFYYYNINVLN